MKVAIQGELGSFSHQAARALVPDAELVACRTSAEAFGRLEAGTADGIVVPIENTLAGAVSEHLDLLRDSDIAIIGEHWLRIRHNLIASPGVKLADVRRALSHPVALAQCKTFFAGNPQIAAEPFYDTAGAVKHVIASGSSDSAGIASELAAEIYGGAVLQSGIEDSNQNFTRFLKIVRSSPKHRSDENPNKVSISFEVLDRPGALAEVLLVFERSGANLTFLQTRPIVGKPGRYTFFVDAAVADPAKLADKNNGLKNVGTNLRVLGIYTAAEIVRG